MKFEIKFIMEYILTPLLIILMTGGIIMGIERSYGYFIISILGLIALLFFQKNNKERQIRKIKERISNQWGKEQGYERNFIDIEKIHIYLMEKEDLDFYIDDITWRDLNMDSVFAKIDHTKSLVGMQYLYHILRKPLFEKEILSKRKTKSNALVKDIDLAQSIQMHLIKLGKEEGENIIRYFKNGIRVDKKSSIVYTICSYLPFLVAILYFINKSYGFLALIGIISLNTALYRLNKKNLYEEMETFKYLGNLIKTAEEIIKIDTKDINLGKEEMKILLKDMKVLRKNINKIKFNDSLSSEAEIFIDYYNMITLREPKVFYKTVNLINKYKEELFEIHITIGKMDAYISIASYKSSLNYYTEPDFEYEESGFHLKTENVYHPLLEDPVSYSIELDNKGGLVTGSNASGKSTFLRTIGVNSIFAQTLNLVLAKEYKSSYFKLLTSIGTTDNIVEGDSYFMAEAKSLKRIIDSLSPNQPILCILDEIFRGTNTAERISAALESLNYMIHKNACVIAATHDIELTNLVNDRYNNYHFREIIETNDIKFDYILRNGPCTTRNAIAILEYLGYPAEIYENATRSAAGYLEQE